MFEEKTLIAQKKGAVATVIVNTDDSIFVMAGKQVIYF